MMRVNMKPGCTHNRWLKKKSNQTTLPTNFLPSYTLRCTFPPQSLNWPSLPPVFPVSLCQTLSLCLWNLQFFTSCCKEACMGTTCSETILRKSFPANLAHPALPAYDRSLASPIFLPLTKTPAPLGCEAGLFILSPSAKPLLIHNQLLTILTPDADSPRPRNYHLQGLYLLHVPPVPSGTHCPPPTPAHALEVQYFIPCLTNIHNSFTPFSPHQTDR